MGEFSYMCKECFKAIHADDQVVLFLLMNSKIVEKMSGRYDNYGRVYKQGGTHECYQKTDFENDEESNGINWAYASWHHIVDLCFADRWKDVDGYTHYKEINPSGIAAYHQACYTNQIPTLSSMNDRNQGWGENTEKYPFIKKQLIQWLEYELIWLRKCIDENHLDYIPQRIYSIEDDVKQIKAETFYYHDDLFKTNLNPSRPLDYRKR